MLRELFQGLINAHFNELNRMNRELHRSAGKQKTAGPQVRHEYEIKRLRSGMNCPRLCGQHKKVPG